MIHFAPNLTTPYRILYAVAGLSIIVAGVFRAATTTNFLLYCLGGAILLAESVSGF